MGIDNLKIDSNGNITFNYQNYFCKIRVETYIKKMIIFENKESVDNLIYHYDGNLNFSTEKGFNIAKKINDNLKKILKEYYGE